MSDWKYPCCEEERNDNGEMFSGLEDSTTIYCETCDTHHVVSRTCVFYYNSNPFSKADLLNEFRYFNPGNDWMDIGRICGRSDLEEERFVLPLLDQLVADGSIEHQDGKYRRKKL